MVSLALRRTGLDEQNVAILYHIILALGQDLALGLHFRFITQLLEDVEVVDDDLDKSLLEVGVDDTSGLWCLGTVPDRPLANLVGSGGEEASKIEHLPHLNDDLRESRVGPNLLALLQRLGLCLEARQALFKAY